MKMVQLTIMEARHVLDVLDTIEHAEYEIDDVYQAIEIMEEALHQPQEVDIG